MTGPELSRYLRLARKGDDVWLRYEPWMEGLVGRDSVMRTTAEIKREKDDG